MTYQPWASGPGELLEFGLSLLQDDTDRNRRLAMILIDNAVELMIKTYLGLPRRVTGINVPRRKLQEISESFPSLLDALEEYVLDKIEGINLGEVEFYHRIRNELYHQGNGLTVERNKVEVYSELALLLFKNLYDADISIGSSSESELLGKFLSSWITLEKLIYDLATKHHIGKGIKSSSIGSIVSELDRKMIIDMVTADEILKIAQLRNVIVHGEADFRTDLTPQLLKRLNILIRKIESAS